MRGGSTPGPRKNPPKPTRPPLDLTDSPERPERNASRNSLLVVLALVWLGALTIGLFVFAFLHSCSTPPPALTPTVAKRAEESLVFNLTAASPKSLILPMSAMPKRFERYSVCCLTSDGIADCGLAAGVSVRVIPSAQTLHVLVLAARETQCRVVFAPH